MEIIKHIKLGTNEVFFFNYEGNPLPLRPISSWEFDECFYNSLFFAPKKIAEFVVRIKLGLLGKQDQITIDNASYAELEKYYNTIDYWIVYNAMKDFQKPEFQVSDVDSGIPKGFELVKKMRHVHKIADMIMNSSYKPREVVKEIIKTEEGKILGKMVLYLNQPLSELSKLTRLQTDFLLWSKLDEQTNWSKRKIEKSGDKAIIKQQVGDVVNANGG